MLRKEIKIIIIITPKIWCCLKQKKHTISDKIMIIILISFLYKIVLILLSLLNDYPDFNDYQSTKRPERLRMY